MPSRERSIPAYAMFTASDGTWCYIGLSGEPKRAMRSLLRRDKSMAVGGTYWFEDKQAAERVKRRVRWYLQAASMECMGIAKGKQWKVSIDVLDQTIRTASHDTREAIISEHEAYHWRGLAQAKALRRAFAVRR